MDVGDRADPMDDPFLAVDLSREAAGHPFYGSRLFIDLLDLIQKGVQVLSDRHLSSIQHLSFLTADRIFYAGPADIKA